MRDKIANRVDNILSSLYNSKNFVFSSFYRAFFRLFAWRLFVFSPRKGKKRKWHNPATIRNHVKKKYFSRLCQIYSQTGHTFWVSFSVSNACCIEVLIKINIMKIINYKNQNQYYMYTEMIHVSSRFQIAVFR